VLPFRPAPPSPPLPWDTPRPSQVDHENLAVWAGADGGRSAHPPVATAHPRFTNGEQRRPASPSPPVESEQFWTDGLNDVQRADAQRPRTEADQEWDDHVDEAAYEGASAYSPTTYERSNGYFWCAVSRGAASRGRRMLRRESRAAIAASLRQDSRDAQDIAASAAAIDRSAAAIDRSAARDCENRRQRYRTVRERMTFGDWTPEEWEQMEDAGGRDPISVSSISSTSLPSLASMSPPVPGQYRNPSPPSSADPSVTSMTPPPSLPQLPEPIQLQYVRNITAGPAYALQLSASLRQQPLQERLVLADQLREALISPAEELTLGARRYPGRTATPPSPLPPPPPKTAEAGTMFCSYWSGCGRSGCQRDSFCSQSE
jgi:hypothetical protein